MIEALKSKIRHFFDAPDLHLKDDTDLVALLNDRDPDLFTDFLSEFEREFKVARPVFENPVVPTAAERGLFGRIIDRLVGPDDGQPTHVVVDTITVRELAEIAETRRWPLRFAGRNIA